MKKTITLLTVFLLASLSLFAQSPANEGNMSGRASDWFDDMIEMSASDAGNPDPTFNLPRATIRPGQPMGWYYAAPVILCSYAEPVSLVEVILTPQFGTSSYRLMSVSEDCLSSMIDVSWLKGGKYTVRFSVTKPGSNTKVTFTSSFSR